MSTVNPLETLAARVAGEGDPLSAAAATGPLPPPAVGALAAGGSRTAVDPPGYALVAESVREGYLCHHGRPRLLGPADRDLLLLAGDLFYAIGLARLAELDDPEAVALLSELIRISAELHSAGRGEQTPSLWLAQISALAFGSDPSRGELVDALRGGAAGAPEALETWAGRLAQRCGAAQEFGEMRDVLHSGPADLEFP
jgi:hypothetical protein